MIHFRRRKPRTRPKWPRRRDWQSAPGVAVSSSESIEAAPHRLATLIVQLPARPAWAGRADGGAGRRRVRPHIGGLRAPVAEGGVHPALCQIQCAG